MKSYPKFCFEYFSIIRNLFYLFIFVLFSNNLFSQEVSISFGPTVNELSTIECSDELHYYSVNTTEKGIVVTKYNKGFQLMEERNIIFDNHGETKFLFSQRPFFEDIEWVSVQNDRIYIIYSLIFQREKKITYYLLTLDKKSLHSVVDEKELVAIPHNGHYKLVLSWAGVAVIQDKTKEIAYGLIASADRSKILIYYSGFPSKDKNKSFHFSLFNNRLDLIANGVVDIGIKDEIFLFERVLLSNSGNFILFGTEIGDKKRANNIFENKRHLLAYSFNGVRIADQVLNPYYNNFKDYNSQILLNDSTILFAVDYVGATNAGSMETSNFETMFYTYNYYTKSDKLTEISNRLPFELDSKYQLIHIYESNDSSFLLVFEKQEEQSYFEYYKNINYIHTNYKFDDVVVLKMSLDKKMVWMRRLPKAQRSWNDYGVFGSVFTAFSDGKLYIIYNDSYENAEHVENIENTKFCDLNKIISGNVMKRTKTQLVDLMRNKTNGFIQVLYIINPDGSFVRKRLARPNNNLLIPKSFIITNSGFISCFINETGYGHVSIETNGRK